MDKKEQVCLIESFYTRLDFLNHIKMKNFRDDLYRMSRNEEKKHRDFVGSYYGCTVAVSAKFFVVKTILEGFISYYEHPENKPTVELRSINWTRYSVLLGQSYGVDYSDKISKEITEDDARIFLKNVSYRGIIE